MHPYPSTSTPLHTSFISTIPVSFVVHAVAFFRRHLRAITCSRPVGLPMNGWRHHTSVRWATQPAHTAANVSVARCRLTARPLPARSAAAAVPALTNVPPVDAAPMLALDCDFVQRDLSTCAMAVGTTLRRVSSSRTSNTSGRRLTPASAVRCASSSLTSSGVSLDCPAGVAIICPVLLSDGA
eukprot:CAMPEP_0198686492 /NCGR_PEP_ID=MMETSP1468-20131203/14979_1 /TAXON_ID=1461545 /ORGANISM="Mantoniella sp, Strain CCMP1436" /LENGTH=182 /DNA_ID=CAMNT_0044432635 /DNA_START=154 /DNA_END=701 /DNA_ORIENTATION=+